MEKEEIIKGIKERIKSEFSKHKDLDWAEIAARKIYSSYLKKTKIIESEKIN